MRHREWRALVMLCRRIRLICRSWSQTPGLPLPYLRLRGTSNDEFRHYITCTISSTISLTVSLSQNCNFAKHNNLMFQRLNLLLKRIRNFEKGFTSI